MLHKTILASLLSATVIGAAVAVRLLTKKSDEEDKEDDQVNFINIKSADDDSEDEEPLDQKPAKEESEFPAEVNEIAGLYPYLSRKFIAEQFERNEAFNKEYPEDALISISHKAKFPSAGILADFTGIAENSGYAVEAIGEDECISTKKMFTENGSILSDIYNMANQVAALKGTYEGYRID